MGGLEKNSQGNIYEFLDPEIRFVTLAGAILEKIGESPEDSSNIYHKSATWPSKSQGYHYKLERGTTGYHPAMGAYYVLEHYIDELPPDVPLTRYKLSLHGNSLNSIRVITGEDADRYTDKETKQEYVRQALSILSEAVPQEAEKALNFAFNKRFALEAGKYILSDLAVSVGNKVPKIDRDVAIDAMIEHVLRIKEIEDKVRAKSLKSDSPAKQEFIAEAIEIKPTANRRGKFLGIDLVGVTNHIADQIASNKESRWKNTVSPDQ